MVGVALMSVAWFRTMCATFFWPYPKTQTWFRFLPGGSYNKFSDKGRFGTDLVLVCLPGACLRPPRWCVNITWFSSGGFLCWLVSTPHQTSCWVKFFHFLGIGRCHQCKISRMSGGQRFHFNTSQTLSLSWQMETLKINLKNIHFF